MPIYNFKCLNEECDYTLETILTHREFETFKDGHLQFKCPKKGCECLLKHYIKLNSFVVRGKGLHNENYPKGTK
jgi:predicted nucleic acid-binding Zn ribbon protein